MAGTPSRLLGRFAILCHAKGPSQWPRPFWGKPQSRFYQSTRWLLSRKQGPPRPTVNEEDLVESFVKGSGPGGQKINKTSSAVQLKHTPTGLMVKCQATRSKSQNRKIARLLLAEKVELLEKGDDSRLSIKAEVVRKKKASKSKKSGRKYKALDAAEQPTDDSKAASNDDQSC